MAWDLWKLTRFPVKGTSPTLAEAAIGFGQDVGRIMVSDSLNWRMISDSLYFSGDQDYAPTAANKQAKTGWLIYCMAPTSNRSIDLTSGQFNDGARVTVINRSTNMSNLLVALTASVVHTVRPGETFDAYYIGGLFVVPAPLGAARNVFINSGMEIDQRNDGAAKTFTAGAGRAYGVDRFFVQCSGANMTGQQVAGDVAPKAYRLNGAINVTNVVIGQIIEAANSARLKSRIVTSRVRLKSDSQRTITWTAKRAGSVDTWGAPITVATGQIEVSTIPRDYLIQFNAGTSADLGLSLQLETGALGAGAYLQVEDWEVHEGPVAVQGGQRLYGEELAQCMRFREYSYEFGPYYGTAVGSGAQFRGIVFKVRKRIAPTLENAGCSYYQLGNAVNVPSISWVSVGPLACYLNASGMTNFYGFANVSVHSDAEF